MSIRSWDNWNKYTDNDYNPLHGCIHFVVNEGNTSAPIYDKDGTALNNPQLTDIYGRTQHQVFIEEDVIAYYYKYIGNGEWYTEQSIDPSDTSKWQLQYTSDSELSIDVHITSTSPYTVSNLSDLRTLDVDTVPFIDDAQIITLLGYNESGDKEPINYIWDSSSTAADDSGAVIASTGRLTGRWIMVTPTEHLDVRHYGVFPSNTHNMTDQSVAIQSALTYANSRGLRLFFDVKHEVQDYVYYKLSSITLNPIQQIDVSKGVIFLDSDLIIHSNQVNAFNTDPYFYNGDTTLYSNYAKSSWNIKALFKSDNDVKGHYIIDDSTKSTNVIQLQGWIVDVEDDITGYTFNDCIIEGEGIITYSTFTKCVFNNLNTISDYCSFDSCKLSELIFKDSPVVSNASNCIADVTNFTNKLQLWCSIHYDMGTANLDFNNVPVPTSFTIIPLDEDRTYSNFIGTADTDNPHVFGENANVHNFRFVNCQGNIKLSGAADNTYIFDGCSLNITFTNTSNTLNIEVRNSDITFNDDLSNSTISAVSSTLALNSNYTAVTVQDSILQSTNNLNVDKFYGSNSIINQIITSPQFTFKDCQINKALYAIEYSDSDNYYIDCFFDNCVFNSQLNISSSNADTIVRGTWTNNIGNVESPIVIDRTNLAAADASHTYLYSNNSGTFVPSSEATVLDSIVIITDLSNYTGSEIYARMYDGDGMANSQWYQRGHLYTVRHNTSDPVPSFRFNMFRIGSDAFDVTCTWSPVAQASQAITDNTLPNDLRDWITLGGNTCVFSAVLAESSFTWAPVPPSIPPYSTYVTSAYQLMLFGTIDAGNISGNKLSDLTPYTVNTIMTYKKV
jgi:hypothetical protein